MSRSRNSSTSACPCGAQHLASCCGPFLTHAAVPATAEQLMRSRYSAFVLGDESYLLATWHAGTRPQPPLIEPGTKWLGLEVRAHQPGADGTRATVEFIARYKIGGRAQRLHEVSNFVREAAPDGLRWYYVNGIFPEDPA